MKELNSTSFYEAYNARFLTPSEVAQTFIPPQQYQQLIEAGHSLLIGPRGSGKTSMLKMLQIPALRSWKHEMAEGARKHINYVSVFIPTDIIWFEQMNAIEGIFDDAELERLIIDSAMSFHVLRRLIEVMRIRAEPVISLESQFMSVSINVDTETEFAKYVIEEWALEAQMYSLAGIHRALKRCIARIGDFLKIERINSNEGRRQRFKDSGLLKPEFRQMAANVVDEYNRVVGEVGRKWALCFDELEIAPASLQSNLLKAIRSTDDIFFFKLSMSPYSGRELEIAPPDKRAAPGDDYRLIPLWFPEKNDAMQFSYALASEVLERSGFNSNDPKVVFGHSVLRDDDEQDSYKPNGRNYHFIKSLAANDNSFRDYLKRRHINIEAMHLMSENERAEKIRKIMPVIMHRSYFKRYPSDAKKIQQGVRSRKGGDLYCGWEAISAICEGNPRWIIGLIKDMLANAPEGASKITRETQWIAIRAARGRFRAKLKTFKLSASTAGESHTVLGLIDRIGEVFKSELLSDKFIAEPVNGFQFDQKASHYFRDAVGLAANAGALIYLKQDGYVQMFEDLLEYKFRINYLLATEYYIPLRMGSYRNLSFILDKNLSGKQLLMDLDDNESFDQ